MDFDWADSPRLATENISNKNSLRMGILQKAIWHDSGRGEEELSHECQSASTRGRGQFAADSEDSLPSPRLESIGFVNRSDNSKLVIAIFELHRSHFCNGRSSSATGAIPPA